MTKTFQQLYGNTLEDLMVFFNMQPVKDWEEFKEFWKSLSDEERQYYRHVDLTK